MEGEFTDPGEPEQADTFVVSLADALTCVFGAAIALFLIFLVLVKLDPADVATASVARADSLSEFDLVREQEFAVVVVLTAATCTPLIGFLVNREQPNVETWLSEIGGAGPRCQLFLRFAPGLANPVTLETTRPGRNLAIRVLAGPVYTERQIFSVSPWRGSAPRRVLSLRPNGDLRFEENL